MSNSAMPRWLLGEIKDLRLKEITHKVFDNQRINQADALFLYQSAPLGILALLANYVREQKNDKKVYFNHNFHLEPTNICVFNCNFCSYSRLPGKGGWELSMDEMLKTVEERAVEGITEVHIVGGCHPDRDVYFYGSLLNSIRKLRPQLHIKAFTAVELDYMISRTQLSLDEGLEYLKDNGLQSIPGGGAEIFDPEIRSKICNLKSTGQLWLRIHEAAHKHGIPSNATMLYGHIESYEHRVDHMSQIRDLQDQTKGFNAFIPLKYKNKNNRLSHINEVAVTEDLKNFAIARIFFDNIEHIKSYWPMLGIPLTQLALSFGVDDIDGTINDSTKIYSMAGSTESNPVLTTSRIIELISLSGLIPVERDSIYNQIKIHTPGVENNAN